MVELCRLPAVTLGPLEPPRLGFQQRRQGAGVKQGFSACGV